MLMGQPGRRCTTSTTTGKPSTTRAGSVELLGGLRPVMVYLQWHPCQAAPERVQRNVNNLGADEPNPAYPFPLFESCLRAPCHGVEWVEERRRLAGLSGLRALERLQMVRLLLSRRGLVLRLSVNADVLTASAAVQHAEEAIAPFYFGSRRRCVRWFLSALACRTCLLANICVTDAFVPARDVAFASAPGEDAGGVGGEEPGAAQRAPLV